MIRGGQILKDMGADTMDMLSGLPSFGGFGGGPSSAYVGPTTQTMTAPFVVGGGSKSSQIEKVLPLVVIAGIAWLALK